MAGSAETLGNFVLLTTIVGSFNLGWALYASDYSRYLPAATPSTKVAGYSFLGIALSAVWIEVLGLAVFGAVTNGDADPVHQIDALLGGGIMSAVAMIAIFFGTVAVNAMNDYSGSLSLLAAGIKVWRPVSALIVGVLSFIATLWLYSQNFSTAFENYLLLITYWIGPVVGDRARRLAAPQALGRGRRPCLGLQPAAERPERPDRPGRWLRRVDPVHECDDTSRASSRSTWVGPTSPT